VRRPKHSRPRQHRCNLVSRLYGRVPGLTTLRSERYGRKGSYPCGMAGSPVSDKSLPWHTKVPLLRQCCNTEEIEAGLCAGTHDGAEWALFRSARAIRRGQARMAGMIRPRRREGSESHFTSTTASWEPGSSLRVEAASRCHSLWSAGPGGDPPAAALGLGIPVPSAARLAGMTPSPVRPALCRPSRFQTHGPHPEE
jgi:hypothetical protein